MLTKIAPVTVVLTHAAFWELVDATPPVCRFADTSTEPWALVFYTCHGQKIRYVPAETS
jgi:hypothetical protein